MEKTTHQPVQDASEIVTYYRRLNREGNLYLGIEWERSGIRRNKFEPLEYAGGGGYLDVLRRLNEEAGWQIIRSDGDFIIELQRGETRVTLEGDGRLELVGSPQETLHDLVRELKLHHHEVVEIGNVFNIGWLPVGLQPLHSNKQIKLLPKKRYRLLQNIGDEELMRSMTKRCNGITANFSFTDEQNAIKKVQTAMRILPFVGAMFASSPFARGEISGYLDLRRKCIMRHAPERTGIPENILDESFSLESWIDYYLDLPVILIEEKGEPQAVESQMTFRQWINEGFNGRYPTLDDFDIHVKTTWSDIRLRPPYIEYRVPDSLPFHLAMAFPAFIKGLVCNSGSWKLVAELLGDFSYQELIDLDCQAWKTGLRTEVKGKPMLSYVQELITISNEALHKISNLDVTGTDESVYMAPLKEQIFIKEQSPAEEMVSLYETAWDGDVRRVLEWCEHHS